MPKMPGTSNYPDMTKYLVEEELVLFLKDQIMRLDAKSESTTSHYQRDKIHAEIESYANILEHIELGEFA